MNSSPEYPIQPQPEQGMFLPYAPEDIGLDPDDPDDQQLYRESEGDLELAGFLIVQRETGQQYGRGNITRETYESETARMNQLIDARREALHRKPRP